MRELFLLECRCLADLPGQFRTSRVDSTKRVDASPKRIRRGREDSMTLALVDRQVRSGKARERLGGHLVNDFGKDRDGG